MWCRVETYSGGRLHERPRRFLWGEEWLEVSRVLNRWRGPDKLHFRVAAISGGVFWLTYHELQDRWEARTWNPQE